MNLFKKTLLIRADASEVIGAGHVMRCLALAQTWRDGGGRVLYACCSLPEVFARRLGSEGMEVQALQAETGSAEDARQTLNLAEKHAVTAILVDFYQAPDGYLVSLQDARWKTICIDDNAELASYPVNFVLNQNAHAHPSLYAASAGRAALLLGPRFALLRDEFSSYRGWQRSSKATPQKLLISMGGGNQIPALLTLMDRLAPAFQSLKISIVLARAFADTPLLEERMNRAGLDYEIIFSPGNMAEKLADHDLLISSGGATVWEALFMQMPALFIVIAPNQNASCQALQKVVSHPIAFSLESVTEDLLQEMLHTPALRSRLAQEGRTLVDGKGPERVIEMLCA